MSTDPKEDGRTSPSSTRSEQSTGVRCEARNGLQMPPEVMLELAHKTAALVVERIESMSNESAWEGEFRQELEDQLTEAPPENGRPAAEVLERAAKRILAVAARIDHPRFFGFIPSSPTWPGVLADFMVAGYHVNQCTWLTSSGPSQLELVVIDWIRCWLGYPETAGGLFTSGGSAASVDALVAAREHAGHPERATVYMSDQSHSADIRAARIVGVRSECIRMIPTDGRFRLDVTALARAVADDRLAGFNPVAVCANAGAASTGAIDPLEAMADFCEAEGIWLHVDAAYGGFAVVTEEGKRLLRGVERADSIGLDAHKWFFQPYEAGCLLVKDLRTLERAFAVEHDVLQDDHMGCESPELLGPGPAAEPLGPRLEGLGIDPDVRNGRFPRCRGQRDGACVPSRELRPGESGAGDCESSQSLGIVCFRINPAGTDLDEGRLDDINRTVLARVFWRWPRVHFVDASQRNLCPAAVYRQPHNDLGRRARDAGGRRAVREGGTGRRCLMSGRARAHAALPR